MLLVSIQWGPTGRTIWLAGSAWLGLNLLLSLGSAALLMLGNSVR